MANIINMTPHPIHIVDSYDILLASVIKTFPKGDAIRLAVSTVEVGTIDNVVITSTIFGEPIGLPEYIEGTYYIVSQLVKSAMTTRTDLLVPAEVVRDASGNILGCKSLGQ